MTEDAAVEIVDGNTVWRFDTRVPHLELDMPVRQRLQGHPRPRRHRTGPGMLLARRPLRRRARRRSRGDDGVRLRVDARPGALPVPPHCNDRTVATTERAPTASSGTPHGPTPVSSTGARVASSSTVPASPVARGARCISRRSMPATHPPSGSHRSAGSSRSESTGRRSTTTTESATVRRWARRDWGDHGRPWRGVAPSTRTAARPTPAPSAVVDSIRDELIALAGEPVYVELRRRLT